MKKVALFVDWDNLRNTLTSIQKRHSFKKFNYNDPEQLHYLFRNFLDKDEEIYRIYIYTAKMLSIKEIEERTSSKDRKKLEEWKKHNSSRYLHKLEISNKFLTEIIKQDFVALRLGKLSFRGFQNKQPIFIQKEVDMLLGLDISHLSYMRLADKVMLFSKDTDIIPAMKTARINGLEVVLPFLTEDSGLSDNLIKHSDILRKRSLIQLYIDLIKDKKNKKEI